VLEGPARAEEALGDAVGAGPFSADRVVAGEEGSDVGDVVVPDEGSEAGWGCGGGVAVGCFEVGD